MADEWALRCRGVCKSFPGVQALAGVDMDIRAGEVHVLMGENGAGKSTLMRILAGIEGWDAGRIEFGGRPVRLRHPHDALRLGIAMIHQELMPFPEMTVAENILMGQEPIRRRIPGVIDAEAMRSRAARYLGRLKAGISPGARMKDLSLAEMQTVEIAKALAHQARLIIMDEPTSALASREVEILFTAIRDLKKKGVAILYVSHKLDEVFAIGDMVTVLRDGKKVGTQPVENLTPDRLISLMVGSELAEYPTDRPTPDAGSILLRGRGLTSTGRFQDVDFQVRSGEIVGLAGLMGSGCTDLLRALYGLTPLDAGLLWVGGREVRIRHPREAIRYGIGWLGEDRKRWGLVLSRSVQENLTLSGLARCCRGPWIDGRREREIAMEQLHRFDIKAAGLDQCVRDLSGGNQQKVVLAKVLLTEPEVLLLDEPTRGIDVRAKAEIYRLVAGLAARGKAVIVVSSELPELFLLCHRILVMRHGLMRAELDPRHATQETVMRHAMLD